MLTLFQALDEHGNTTNNPKLSPARLRLGVAGVHAVSATLFYQRPGDTRRPMTALVGQGSNTVILVDPGTELAWDFAAEPFLAGENFLDAVALTVEFDGAVPDGGTLTIGIGNDEPVIAVEDPAPEVDGIVPILFQISDSSGDEVALRVEFDVQGDDVESWTPARPGGLEASAPTPDPALSGIVAPRDPPAAIPFFWDTDHDLAELEAVVKVRFTPMDPVVEGLKKETAAFTVDNNAVPIVQLFTDAVVANADQRRGIPVPFRVIDEEGDSVEVILQWRREGEAFRELPAARNELDAVLADPALRQEHHICTAYPHYAQGRVMPVDAETVRLPELASSASWMLAHGIVGRTLELMRTSSTPVPITATRSPIGLVSPIAVLPLGAGLTALVLDLDLSGNGRLCQIELATGALVREIVTFEHGIPITMCFEHGAEDALLVAMDDAGVRRIERVELATGGPPTPVFVSDGSESAPVRGLASVGNETLVFTAGSSLFQVDYGDPFDLRLGLLLDELDEPWGVARNPHASHGLYLAERGQNRILSIDLDAHSGVPLVVSASELQQPSVLALEDGGTRLLVAVSSPLGWHELAWLELGARGGNMSFPIGEPRPAEISSLATGPDGLRLAVQGDEILVGGGLEQRRGITAYERFNPLELTGQSVTVEAEFEPEPRPGQTWRIALEHETLRASAQGTLGSFLWSSALDVPEGGRVFLRAIPRDAELGLTSDGVAPKSLLSALEVVPLTLGGDPLTLAPRSVASADLDGDGDQDFVSANHGGDNLTIFLQDAPGSFLQARTLGDSSTTNGPVFVTATDLDLDQRLDIVTANRGGHDLTIFFQDESGNFVDIRRLGDSSMTNDPRSVATADLDGDGDRDVVSANNGNRDLRIFFQDEDRTFTRTISLGGFSSSDGPDSVAAADLDQDGDVDLVGTDVTSLRVFFQRAPGSFGGTLQVGDISVINSPVSVAAADLDGDGAQDLAAASFTGLTIFFQRSPGDFHGPPWVLVDFFGNGAHFVTAADLDSDSDLDIVASYETHLRAFFQETPARFTSRPLELEGVSAASIVTGDFDGDGGQDLATANDVTDDLSVYFQQSPGAFANSTEALSSAALIRRPVSAVAGDFDNDGDLDIASANALNLTLFLEETPGRYADPLLLSFPLERGPPHPTSIAAADIDDDGDLDIVSTDETHDNLRLFLQVAPETFESEKIGGSATTRRPQGVAAADFDGDGRIDIVSANLRSNSLTIFYQATSGGFPNPPQPLGNASITDGPVAVVVADLDGNGQLDLVSANSAGDDLTVFLQREGAFDPLQLGGSGISDGPASVAVADLDGDGDLDLVSANSASDDLTIFLQEGNAFAEHFQLGGPAITDAPACVIAVDLDHDGDQDLVCANEAGNDLTAFFQESPGHFAPLPRVIGGLESTLGPVFVLSADLDGDGETDLASANKAGDNLTLFFGGR